MYTSTSRCRACCMSMRLDQVLTIHRETSELRDFIDAMVSTSLRGPWRSTPSKHCRLHANGSALAQTLASGVSSRIIKAGT